MQELCSGILSSEVPFGFCLCVVSVLELGSDFGFQRCLVRDAAGQALSAAHAEFAFRDIQPRPVFGRVMPFEAIGDAFGFGRWKGFIERCAPMGVQVVLNQIDLIDLWEVNVRQISESLIQNGFNDFSLLQ